MSNMDMETVMTVVDNANGLYQDLRTTITSTNAAIVKDSTPLFMKASTISDQRLVEACHMVTYGFTMLPMGVEVDACLYALSSMVSSVLNNPSVQQTLYKKYQLDYRALGSYFRGKNNQFVSEILAEWIAEYALCKVKYDRFFFNLRDVIANVLVWHLPLTNRKYSTSDGDITN